jgi:transcription-repair coupling factor (superfamily II helicase)
VPAAGLHQPLHRRQCRRSAIAPGGGQWEKAKRKAAEQIRDSAAELLNIYAHRAARRPHSFIRRATTRFYNDFGFDETPTSALRSTPLIRT